MRLRLLFTLALALCMSAMASPNECARHCRHSTVCKDMTPGTTAVTPADSERSTLLISRLLYI